VDKASVAEAKANNEFVRVDEVDPTVTKGTFYGQPEGLPKLQNVRPAPPLATASPQPAQQLEPALEAAKPQVPAPEQLAFDLGSAGEPVVAPVDVTPTPTPSGPVGAALAPKAVGSAFQVANVVQAYTMARNMTIEHKSPGRAGPAILEDEGGKYVINTKPGILFDDHYKTYISGEREGTTVELGFFEFRHEVAKRNDKYGYFDWKGDWVYGEQAPIMLPPGMI
jgi:hypothetical protein